MEFLILNGRAHRLDLLSWTVALGCGHKLETVWSAVVCAPGVRLPKSPWRGASPGGWRLWTHAPGGFMSGDMVVRESVVYGSWRQKMLQSQDHNQNFQLFTWPPLKSGGSSTYLWKDSWVHWEVLETVQVNLSLKTPAVLDVMTRI